MNHVRYLGRKEQERMIANGWSIRLPESLCETPNHIFDRLSKRYSKVKVYYEATVIRGYHSYFAMVKR